MLKRIFKGFIRSHEQSDEHHANPELKTRYYKIMKDKAWDEIIEVMNKLPGYQFCFEMKKSGELVYMKKTATGRIQDITLTITKTGSLQTAVDIYSASRGIFGDFGSNYRIVRQIYRALDEHFKNRT